MGNKSYKRITVSRPEDKSLDSYKAWMMEIAMELSTEKTEIRWTEQEWIANWKKFWQEEQSS